MNKKMPIHSARELKISVDEIKALLNGDNSKISFITNELLLAVINGDIKNSYAALEDAVLSIIDRKENNLHSQDNFNPYVDQVEDNERILSLLEHNREISSKVGEVIENQNNEIVSQVNKEEIIDLDNNELQDDNLLENVKIVDSTIHTIDENEEQNIITDNIDENENNSDNDKKLLEMFNNDFNELYRIHHKNVFEELIVSELNEEEIEKYESQIKEDVKKILIEKNSNYKYLNDRGII